MRMLEHQAKALLRSAGIAVPRSRLATKLEEAKDAAPWVGFPLVMKAQVLSGGRAKAGGVLRVESPEDVAISYSKIASLSIGGSRPLAILLEEFVPHSREYYLSIALNRRTRDFVLIASGEGGVDVDSIGEKVTRSVDNARDLASAVQIAQQVGLSGEGGESFGQAVLNLINLWERIEAELVEVNPLVFVGGKLPVALDGKIIVDDNALFRHPELLVEGMEGIDERASKEGFSFVELGGDIAVIGNGAGLVLSTLDLLKEAGGEPACFLDLGGGASAERILSALRFVSDYHKARMVLLNVFGGITRCEDVASAIRQSYREGWFKKRLFLRLSGAGEEEGRRILSEIGVQAFADVADAILSLTKSIAKDQIPSQ